MIGMDNYTIRAHQVPGSRRPFSRSKLVGLKALISEKVGIVAHIPLLLVEVLVLMEHRCRLLSEL